MENVLTFTLSETKLDKNNVLQLVDFRKDSPVFEEVMEDYAEVEEIFQTIVKPQTRLLFDEIPPEIAGDNFPAGTRVIYLIHTIGKDVSEYATKAFNEYDYLKGMLMDAMASSYLFAMDKEVSEILKSECTQRGVGIRCRLEAPRDISMLAQKIACDKLFHKDHSVVRTSSAYMLDPPKSNCEIFVLTDNKDMMHTEIDCSACMQTSCPMRKSMQISVSVIQKDGTKVIHCKDNESLLNTLRRHKMYSSAACGGTGKCGKCKVQFLEGVIEPTYADRTHFPEREIAAGIRLACQAFPKTDCTISMDFPDESTFEILSETAYTDTAAAGSPEEAYAIAVDIGTTTIAAALVGLSSKRPIAYYTTLNRQRMYGADVISRMQASTDGKKDLLRESIREDILLCISRLIKDNKIDRSRITRMVLAGNTTMGHLLRGYSCQTLGVFPFTPVSIEKEEMSFKEMLGSDMLDCRAILFPGISTFVGGDIVSGLLACGYADESGINLFIDLGTNGEMAVGNKDKILTTSTAAGPAFEGGNILWGTGSIQGAISSVSIKDGQASVGTIGNKPPVGICGTGIIESMSELLKAELIDETGLLDDRYFASGFPLAKTPAGEDILVTQRDVREIQLAKSAVRAGIEVLLKRYGAEYADIDTLWLAGGFGVKIDQEKAIEIGMLPAELDGRIRAVGNSSLSGAIQYSTSEPESEKISHILDISTEINLSNDKDFNELYVEHMFF